MLDRTQHPRELDIIMINLYNKFHFNTFIHCDENTQKLSVDRPTVRQIAAKQYALFFWRGWGHKKNWIFFYSSRYFLKKSALKISYCAKNTKFAENCWLNCILFLNWVYKGEKNKNINKNYMYIWTTKSYACQLKLKS